MNIDRIPTITFIDIDLKINVKTIQGTVAPNKGDTVTFGHDTSYKVVHRTFMYFNDNPIILIKLKTFNFDEK